jgi:hypothetical protein
MIIPRLGHSVSILNPIYIMLSKVFVFFSDKFLLLTKKFNSRLVFFSYHQ